MKHLSAIALALLLGALTLGACGSESIDPEAPEPIGPLAYEVIPVWCSSECETFELYRDGRALQLLIFTDDHQFDREVLATLPSDTAATFDADVEALLDGEAALGELDPECLGFADAPHVTLALVGTTGNLRFSYPWNCPPSGLVDIDAVYQGLISTLPAT